MGPIGCPKTSVNKCQSTPRNRRKNTQLVLHTAANIANIIISCSEGLPHSLLFRDFKQLGSLDHILDDGLFSLVQCWVLTSTERLQLLRLHRPSSLQPTQRHIYSLMKQRSFKDTRTLIGLGCQYDPSVSRPHFTVRCYLVLEEGTILVTPAQSSRLDKWHIHTKVLGT